jgi:hypothetical protein
MRLNGWMRIGVVLSIVWMVGATGYYEYQHGKDDAAYWQAVLLGRSACIGDNAARRYEGKPEFSCDIYDVDTALKRKTPFLVAVIAPAFWLIVAWIGIGLTYISVRWIRQGFSRSV